MQRGYSSFRTLLLAGVATAVLLSTSAMAADAPGTYSKEDIDKLVSTLKEQSARLSEQEKQLKQQQRKSKNSSAA